MKLFLVARCNQALCQVIRKRLGLKPDESRRIPQRIPRRAVQGASTYGSTVHSIDFTQGLETDSDIYECPGFNI